MGAELLMLAIILLPLFLLGVAAVTNTIPPDDPTRPVKHARSSEDLEPTDVGPALYGMTDDANESTSSINHPFYASVYSHDPGDEF